MALDSLLPQVPSTRTTPQRQSALDALLNTSPAPAPFGLDTVAQSVGPVAPSSAALSQGVRGSTPRVSALDSLLQATQPTPTFDSLGGPAPTSEIDAPSDTEGAGERGGLIARTLDRLQQHIAGRLRIADEKMGAVRFSPATALMQLGTGASDVAFENVAHGVRKGSLLLPDPQYELEDSRAAIQIAAGLAAAVGEGFGAERIALKALSAVAHGGKASPQVAQAAEGALRLFGQDPSFSFGRQIAGSALLSGTVQAGIEGVALAAGDQSLEHAGLDMALATVPGFTIGGVAAGLSFAGKLPARLARAQQATSQALTESEMATLSQRFQETPSLTLGDRERVVSLHSIASKLRRSEPLSTDEQQVLVQFRTVGALEAEADRILQSGLAEAPTTVARTTTQATIATEEIETAARAAFGEDFGGIIRRSSFLAGANDALKGRVPERTEGAYAQGVEWARARIAQDTPSNPIDALAQDGAATPTLEAGLRATQNVVQRDAIGRILPDVDVNDNPSIESARALMRESVVKTRPPGLWQSSIAKLREFGESVRESFVYEDRMRAFPSFERTRDGAPIPELTFADDVRTLSLYRGRARKYTMEALQDVYSPMLRLDPREQQQAFDDFEDLVVLRDLKETAERGLTTGQLRAEDISLLLADVETRAHPSVFEAAARHQLMTSEMRDELVKRGRLAAGAGFESYLPHVVIQSLADAQSLAETGKHLEVLHPTIARLRSGAIKTPFRPYTKERGGSARPIVGDYLQVMSRALAKYFDDNVLDDFLDGVERGFGIKHADLKKRLTSAHGRDLAEKLIDELDRFDRVTLPNGEVLQAFNPGGKTLYRAHATDDVGRSVVEGLLEGQELPAGASVKFREVLALGRDKQVILPAEIAQRLEQFYLPNPKPGITRYANALTRNFKTSAIAYGFMQYFQLNLLGDSVNLLRSNPKAFKQFPRAIAAAFAHYRVPAISVQQLTSAGAGSALGAWTAGEVSDDPEFTTRAATMLIGAGLGYTLGTRGFTIGNTPVARALGLANKSLLPSKVGTAAPKPLLEEIYDLADQVGAANNGFVTNLEETGLQVLGESIANHPAHVRSGAQRFFDTVAMFLSGKPVGQPRNPLGARSAFEVFERLNAERENVFRMASYLQNLEDGMPSQLAVKRANESLVDYGRLTEFESRYLRGALLPFYAFYRQNSANWLKAIAGKDVGGRPKTALMALGALASFDIVSQQWNERFFGETEEKLAPYMRKSFHIIAGNPATGEVFTNKRGEPMVLGLEMPYESALELLGLARPGVIVSELSGVDFGRESSLVGRVRDAEGWDRASEAVKAPIVGMIERVTQLLNPLVRIPLEVASNKNFFFDSPLVPDRFTGTSAERGRILNYLAESYFRQLREGKKLVRQAQQGRFNPVSSPYGLGIPLRNPDLNRNVQGRLHELFDAAERDVKERRAAWMKDIDEVFYARQDFETPEPQEMEMMMQKISELPIEEQDAAAQYYLNRSTKGALQRRWSSLTWQERAQLARELKNDPASEAAFWFYQLGGKDITDPVQKQLQQQSEQMPPVREALGVP